MNLTHLGEQIDIHGGGTDLIFPHHENEIAQSESLTGKPFARYWMHNGMLQLVNPKTRQIEKMSKSLGNVVTIRDFLARHNADVFRLLVVGSHYRSPLTYNEEIAADTERKLERLQGGLLPPVGRAEDGPAAEALARETAAALETLHRGDGRRLRHGRSPRRGLRPRAGHQRRSGRGRRRSALRGRDRTDCGSSWRSSA